MEDDSEPTQLRYAQSLADYADAGGYDAEVIFDACCTEALGISYDQAKWREISTLSGGEQKRLALEALLRGPDEVLLLDEPDNFLDVPGEALAGDSAAEHPEIGAGRQPRPRAAGSSGADDRGARAGRCRQFGLDSRSRFRDAGGGASRPVRPPRGATAALGRGAPEAAGADADVQEQGGVQLRNGLPLPGCSDPTGQVRGGRAASGGATGAARCRCGSAAGVRASARSSSTISS